MRLDSPPVCASDQTTSWPTTHGHQLKGLTPIAFRMCSVGPGSEFGGCTFSCFHLARSCPDTLHMVAHMCISQTRPGQAGEPTHTPSPHVHMHTFPLHFCREQLATDQTSVGTAYITPQYYQLHFNRQTHAYTS